MLAIWMMVVWIIWYKFSVILLLIMFFHVFHFFWYCDRHVYSVSANLRFILLSVTKHLIKHNFSCQRLKYLIQGNNLIDFNHHLLSLNKYLFKHNFLFQSPKYFIKMNYFFNFNQYLFHSSKYFFNVIFNLNNQSIWCKEIIWLI